MVAPHELITVCRQIGAMMEAGVDILRITRVLRAQTQNPRLLELYEAFDHDLRMGASVADAMERAPDVFSPFATSLVRQGEARNDLAGAFLKLADFLQQEGQTMATVPPATRRDTAPSVAQSGVAPSGIAQSGVAGDVEAVGIGRQFNAASSGTALPGSASSGLVAPSGVRPAWSMGAGELQAAASGVLMALAALFLALSLLWWSIAGGLLDRRWSNALGCLVLAGFAGAAAVWMQRSAAQRSGQARCSFCGTIYADSAAVQRALPPSAAAICQTCAASVSGKDRVGEVGPPMQAALPGGAGAPASADEAVDADSDEAVWDLSAENWPRPAGAAPPRQAPTKKPSRGGPTGRSNDDWPSADEASYE